MSVDATGRLHSTPIPSSPQGAAQSHCGKKRRAAAYVPSSAGGRRRTRHRLCNPVGIDDGCGGTLTQGALRDPGLGVELLRSSDDGVLSAVVPGINAWAS